jgi:hypothetical protein
MTRPKTILTINEDLAWTASPPTTLINLLEHLIAITVKPKAINATISPPLLL